MFLTDREGHLRKHPCTLICSVDRVDHVRSIVCLANGTAPSGSSYDMFYVGVFRQTTSSPYHRLCRPFPKQMLPFATDHGVVCMLEAPTSFCGRVRVATAIHTCCVSHILGRRSLGCGD